MTKVLTLVGTRPELIKLSLVIGELDRQFKHVLVHSGQNYDFELNEVFFEDLKIRRPDHFLEAAAPTPAATIARVIERIDSVLELERPDAFLVLGDTNSALATIAAKRRRVPVFHMEAGNRCFDDRVPEEVNRRIVDHISDINLVYTEHARRYLLAEGVRPETVIKTGSPMREVLATFAASIDASSVLARLDLAPGSYFVASAHREENVDDPSRLLTLVSTLETLAATYGKRVVFSVHPRTRARLESAQIAAAVQLIKPLGFFDYVKLQREAFCVVSDSGTLTEEAAILGFPAVMLRETHERPEGMDEATVVMAGIERGRVIEAVRIVHSHRATPPRAPADYEAADVSRKVARIIASHIDFIRRTVY
jgi:UDP-N-acetylglucosamine 2-epimerase (non-hydrolysing)